MRPYTVLLATILALSGCGGGSSPSLVGTWADQVNDTCGVGMTFQPDSTYAIEMLCLTETGANYANAEVEGEAGTYTVVGNQLTTTPQKSSCPLGVTGAVEDGTSNATAATFQIQGNRLTVSGPAGAVSLVRDTDAPTGSYNLTWGCFVMGAFEAHPLASY